MKTRITTLILTANNIRIKQTEQQYQELRLTIRDRGGDIWMNVPNINDEDCWILKTAVVGLRCSEIATTKDQPEGISIKALCERFPKKWKYPTLVRKVNKPGGIDLEMSSERKIAFTEKNRISLKLTESEWQRLINE